MRRRLLLVLAGVLAVQAFLTVLVFSPVPHDGGDNAGYVALAYSILDRGAYLEIWDPQEPFHTKYPPVFPLLLAAAMALGVKGWVGLKMIPVGSTLLAGLFAFLWARERGGLALGATVALLLALSNGVLYYSHWVLSDPSFLALTLGALWALERWERKGERVAEDPGEHSPESGVESGVGPGVGSGASGKAWLALGLTLVVSAYFTRSAGLPLVVATLAWLSWRRHWRVLAGFLLIFGPLALLWWLRGRMAGGGEYVSEFWLIDPYQPELGQVGPGGLAGRVGQNLWLYVTYIIPAGVVGMGRPLLPFLGGGLFLLALVGWVRRFRERGGVGEIFFPLYGGLILLWPVVWSGDRFALPLFPFIFFYAGSALLWLLKGRRVWIRRSVVGLVILLLAAPALLTWSEEVRRARICGEIVGDGDPYVCYGVNIQRYAVLARWAGLNLPDGASVVTRKPRIFFVLSGVKAQAIPYTSDPDGFLAQLRGKGSGYLVLDEWDTVAPYYILPVIQARPQLFCYITGLGQENELGTELFGLQEGAEQEGAVQEEEIVLPDCPPGLLRPEPREAPSAALGDIPLLVLGRR